MVKSRTDEVGMQRLAIRAACRGLVRGLLRQGAQLGVVQHELQEALGEVLGEEIDTLGISTAMYAGSHDTYPNHVGRMVRREDGEGSRELFKRNVARVLARSERQPRTVEEIAEFLKRVRTVFRRGHLVDWRARNPEGFAACPPAVRMLRELDEQVAVDPVMARLAQRHDALRDTFSGPVAGTDDYGVAEALLDLQREGRVVVEDGEPGFEARWRIAASHIVWDGPPDPADRMVVAAAKIGEFVQAATGLMVAQLGEEGDEPGHVDAMRLAISVPELADEDAQRDFNHRVKAAIDGVVDAYPDATERNVMVTFSIRHLLAVLAVLAVLLPGRPTPDLSGPGDAVVSCHTDGGGSDGERREEAIRAVG